MRRPSVARPILGEKGSYLPTLPTRQERRIGPTETVAARQAEQKRKSRRARKHTYLTKRPKRPRYRAGAAKEPGGVSESRMPCQDMAVALREAPGIDQHATVPITARPLQAWPHAGLRCRSDDRRACSGAGLSLPIPALRNAAAAPANAAIYVLLCYWHTVIHRGY
jgi:hypothetical protein